MQDFTVFEYIFFSIALHCGDFWIKSDKESACLQENVSGRMVPGYQFFFK